MKNSKELKIGVFVVVVLTASFFLINYLRGEDIFNREIEILSRYDNVEGLVASAPVYIRGFKAGKVTEVIYEPDTDDFKVVCSVLKEFRIPKDSKMTIYGVDIMGGKGIRLDLGSSTAMVEDGEYIESSFEAGLMDGLASEIGPLLSKVNSTIDSLGVTVSGVNKVLSEKNTESFGRTIAHIDKTMADVRALAANMEGKSEEFDIFVDNLAGLSEKFNGIAEKVDTTVAGVNDFMLTLNSSDLEGTVNSFHELLKNVNDPDGSIGKLLVNDSVYNSVDSLLNDVDILVKRITENPKKYIKISVF